MAGYVRQSSAEIIPGATVRAAPLNVEYNTIQDAFAAITGHRHDGNTGEGGYVPLIADADNKNAVVIDTANNRISFFTEVSTVRTEQLRLEDGVLYPVTNNDIDLGTSALQFKNLYIDGTANIDAMVGDTLALTSNASVGGTLSVTGATTLTGAATLSSSLTVAGATALNGNVTVGNAATDTVGVTAQITTSLVPNVDDSVDLGSATNEWRNLYIDGTANIDSLNADLVNIDDGSIDGTDIGAAVPATAAFTTLDVTTSADFAGATISDLGTVTTADIDGGSIDGVTIGTNSAVADLRVDNIKVDGNAITSTNSNGNIDLTPNGTGEVNISKVDIDAGTIDGTTIGATSHTTGKFTTLQSTGQATLATVDINGGAIDGTAIGNTTPSTGAFTTVSASGGFTGALSGNVTGNVTGNVEGNVNGNVIGNLSGNVTSTGTSTFQDVTISGTLSMDADTEATITNLTAPTNDTDAATKKYVDDSVADLIDLAPEALDTLNELAAALGDDENFATNVYSAINNQVNAAGDTMTGTLDMGANKVTTTLNPTTDSELTRKAYVDAQRDTRVAKSGDTMSGNLAMGSNNITGLATPTADDHATTKLYVDNILGSATVAAASAAAALASEQAAATSEGNALNSANAAEADRITVEGIYDQFDDRYLGSKTEPPALDNDGNALLIGALYFNTSSNLMYVYSSSGWVTAGSAVNGTSDRYSYTAAESQTTFSGADNNGSTLAYDSGYVDVYLNGVRLVDGVDFTANTGTSLQLTTAANTGDSLEVVAYGTFILADHYTKTEADARFLNVSGDGMSSDLTFGDNVKATFGAGNDLQIYSNGDSSFISEQSSTGSLNVLATNFYLYDGSFAKYMMTATANGAVDLRYDGAQKIATTSTGVDVTGEITADGIALGDNQKATFGASDDLQIYHDSATGNSFIKEGGAGSLKLLGTNLLIKTADDTENYIKCTKDDAVQLYYDNSVKLATTSTGISVTGTTDTDTVTLPNGWVVSESGGSIYIAVNGTNMMKLDSTGKLQVAGDIESNATIS
jgi:hypothetical protein